MKSTQSNAALFVAALAFAGLGLAVAESRAENPRFTPTWHESGMFDRIGNLPYVFFQFSTEAPGTLKKAPADVVDPLFASVLTGSDKPRMSHPVVVEVKDKVPTRLFVDANADGEFSADEVFAWESKQMAKSTQYRQSVRLKLNNEGKMGVVIFRYMRLGETPFSQKEPLLACICDYGVTGELKVGDRHVPTALFDVSARADFSSMARGQAPLVWFDGNTNGAYDPGELFAAYKTFKAMSTTWAITNASPDGAFELVAVPAGTTMVKAKEIAGNEVNLNPGQKAPTFTANLMDGKPVQFPSDYKGKLVLVDFWATWCGPCLQEVPNVVANYEKYHAQGLEILGISLDRPDATKQIEKVTKAKNMTWPQIYDGQFWDATVAKLYGIRSIPHMVLVDGDTGVILADGKAIRGEGLGEAIEAALAARKKQ